MKKIILLFSALFFFAQADARIRTTHVDPMAGTIKIKNVAGFAYDYSNFMLSINGVALNLSLQAISRSVDMDLDVDEEVIISGLTIPAAASLAIWYNGVDPTGNPMVSDLVDFMQFGSAGHEHEALAVSAGLWTAGEFVGGAAPYMHSGAGEGAGNWSNSGSVGVEESVLEQISIYPNPCIDKLSIRLSAEIDPVDVVILNAIGQVVASVKQLFGNPSIDVADLDEGVYLVQLSRNDVPIKTVRMMKTN